MKKVCALIFTVLLIVIISSCSRGEVYFKYKQVDKGEWTSDTPLVFELDSLLVDPSLKYDFQLDVVYSNLYPYHDLWLVVSNNLVDTISLQDTIRVVLVDEYGTRTGSGNAGYYQLSLPYKTDVFLDTISTYTVSVSHAMRDGKLKGIEKIGLKVSEKDYARR